MSQNLILIQRKVLGDASNTRVLQVDQTAAMNKITLRSLCDGIRGLHSP